MPTGSQQSFTDEQLKRTKIITRLKRRQHNLWRHMIMSDFESLLLRLETAEKYASYVTPIESEGRRLLKAWRKACGK